MPKFLWILVLLLLSTGTTLAQSSNPKPTACATVVTITVNKTKLSKTFCAVPTAAAAGYPDTTITIFGSGFLPSSIVQWNGQSRATTLAVDSATNLPVLKVLIFAADFSNIGTNNITIFNPDPGGGTSKKIPFNVYKACGVELGSLDGVEAKSNGANTTTGQGCDSSNSGQWECVDFIKRYYRDALGIVRATSWFGDAQYYFSSAQSDQYEKDSKGKPRLVATNKNLSPFPNGGAMAPAERDIIVFNTPYASNGHVAIIKTIDDGCKTPSQASVTSCNVTVIEQNWSKDAYGSPLTLTRNQQAGQTTYDLVRGSSAYKVVGWLRASDANLRPTGSFDGIDTAGTISGWAEDPDNLSVPIQVHIYIDKNLGTSGASPVAVLASDFRQNVGNHAFNYVLPNSYKDGRNHTVWVWAIDLTDTTGVRNIQLVGSPSTFNISPTIQPPTAGFLIISGNQSASDGQAPLNITVVPGGSAPVSISAGASHANVSGGSIVGWNWSVNGSQVSAAPSFGRDFSKGTYQIGLVVTDNAGAISAPATGTIVVTEVQANFTPTGSMNEGRSLFVATLLNNGTVLVTGGSPGGDVNISSTAELYNPVTGTWRYTAFPMTTGRSDHTSVKLLDGRVLVIGGLNGSILSSAEIFDPLTERFTATPPMNSGHTVNGAVLLQDGRVLVIGGYLSDVCEIYDPTANSWTLAAPLPYTAGHVAAVLLPDGSVLVTGGVIDFLATSLVSSYNPSTNTWRAMTPMLVPRLDHTATLLPNSKVLIVAGTDASYTVASTELYDPTVLPSGSSTFDTTLNQNRRAHTTTLLPNGDVLVTGGYEARPGGVIDAYLSSAELRDHVSGQWNLVAPMSIPRQAHIAVLLPSGAVLVAGGATPLPSNTAELWNP